MLDTKPTGMNKMTVDLDHEFQRQVIEEQIDVEMIATFLNDQEDNVYLYQYENHYFITIDCHMAAGIYADADQYHSLDDAKETFLSIVDEQNITRKDNGYDAIKPKFY